MAKAFQMLRNTSAWRVKTIEIFSLLFGCLFQINMCIYYYVCIKKKERKENNKIKTQGTRIILINQNKLFFYVN